MFRRISFVVTALILLTAVCPAEEEFRTWTAKTGSTIEAKCIQKTGAFLVLQTKGGKKVKIARRSLSSKDIKYLQADEVRGLGKQPPPPKDFKWAIGRPNTTSIKTGEEGKWSYFIYFPSTFNLSRKWPVMFVISPEGGKAQILNQFSKGAELNEFIIAVSGQAKSGFGASDHAVNAMVKDVKEKFPIDEKRMYSAGCMVGAQIGFTLAEKHKETGFAGVLTCNAGGLGRELAPETIVYGLCGVKSYKRWEMACAFKKHFHKSSKLQFVAGAEEWPANDHLSDGMCYLNGLYLKKFKSSTDKTISAERFRYSKKMLDLIDSLAENNPERAYKLVDYLEDSGVHSYFSGDLRETAAKLRKVLKVKKYIDAQESMKDFSDKYFSTDPGGYTNSLPTDLKAEAKALAEVYKDLHMSRIFDIMTQPTSMPQ